jgi:hypothetical protein
MKLMKLLPLAPLALAVSLWAQNGYIPQGTEIKVRTDTSIPPKPAADARYTATVSQDVTNDSGGVAIPRGSRADLVAVPNSDGKDTTLDLREVTVNGQIYELEAKGASRANHGGLGANKRTGKYVGGGAAIGAVLGAILGGGKGAAIGAILGGAGGAGAQVYTGKNKDIPAETQLSYKLAEDLEMRTVADRPPEGLQTRPPEGEQTAPQQAPPQEAPPRQAPPPDRQ